MTTPIILLVEDNADDELLTVRAFAKSNIANQVVVVRDGVEALDWLFCEAEYSSRDPSEEPQLMLLDLKLPRLDGLGVLRRMRADPRTALLPVIVLTSSDQDEDVARSYELGANGYVRKPVAFDQFVAAVEHVGLFWLVLNRRPPRRRGSIAG
ncbi:MAG: response regulator receiver protein [Labilithrix sp.]|nr:response regulator receiver protein [Labilithrix sp.]